MEHSLSSHGALTPGREGKGTGNGRENYIMIVTLRNARLSTADRASAPDVPPETPDANDARRCEMSGQVVTPTQDLILELLAARHRLGHNIWTLTASAPVARALRALAVRGLVGWKHGVVEHTYLAWLTDQGRREYMTAGYVPPILGGAA